MTVGLIICWKTGPYSPFAPVLETDVQKHFSQYITAWQLQYELIHYFSPGCILSKEMHKKKNRIIKKNNKKKQLQSGD